MKLFKRTAIIIAALIIIGAAAFIITQPRLRTIVDREIHPVQSESEIKLIAHPRTPADKIVNGAKLEALRGVRYDAAYTRIPYPNGDVPKDQGACTDVIIRALRYADYDLQQLMHEDMSRHFDLYPRKWGLTSPDPNIDHRRVPNQIAFMKRFGEELPTSTQGDAARTWKPGDLVYWNLTPTLTHCGVISNDRRADGLPLVIHNIGPTVRQEDCLTNWPIIGHFRYPNERH